VLQRFKPTTDGATIDSSSQHAFLPPPVAVKAIDIGETNLTSFAFFINPLLPDRISGPLVCCA
jgi:hypothetical protein